MTYKEKIDDGSSKPFSLKEYKEKFLEKEMSKMIKNSQSESQNEKVILSEEISLKEYRDNFLEKEMSEMIKNSQSENQNEQLELSERISLADYSGNFLDRGSSRRIRLKRSKIIKSAPNKPYIYREVIKDTSEDEIPRLDLNQSLIDDEILESYEFLNISKEQVHKHTEVIMANKQINSDIEEKSNFNVDMIKKNEKDVFVGEKQNGLYLSTKNERNLVEKIFKLVIHYDSGKLESTAYTETVISDIIRKNAIEKGYNKSDFPERSFYKQIKRKNYFGYNFLEKYIFLFKFSKIFSKNDRKLLLIALNEYLIKKKIKQSTSVHKKLLYEYSLIKKLQTAYFREHKKYITITEIGNEVDGSETNSNTTLKKHFDQNRGVFKFHKFTMFKIELWANNNLNVYLNEVHDMISEWRERNNDDSLYASHDTPFRDIAYDMIILYAYINNIIINLASLDRILKKQFPKQFPKQFFNRRINQNRDEKNNMTSTDLIYKGLLIRFIEDIFKKYAPKRSKLLIDKIEKYINKKNIRISHSYFFTKLKPFQMKLLLDITKGMDVNYCDFFSDAELISTVKLGGICRAHIDEDADFNFIFDTFLDGERESYRFKLAPLRFLSSHHETHNRQFPIELINDLVEARIRHLFELCSLPYDNKFSRKYYNNKFKRIFEEKKDFIPYYGENANIWDEFYDNITDKTVSGLTNENIFEFVKRWIDSKKMNEQSWYIKYYEEFYAQKYLDFLQKLEKYKKNRGNSEIKPFYEWFLEEYLNKERFP